MRRLHAPPWPSLMRTSLSKPRAKRRAQGVRCWSMLASSRARHERRAWHAESHACRGSSCGGGGRSSACRRDHRREVVVCRTGCIACAEQDVAPEGVERSRHSSLIFRSEEPRPGEQDQEPKKQKERGGEDRWYVPIRAVEPGY